MAILLARLVAFAVRLTRQQGRRPFGCNHQPERAGKTPIQTLSPRPFGRNWHRSPHGRQARAPVRSHLSTLYEPGRPCSAFAPRPIGRNRTRYHTSSVSSARLVASCLRKAEKSSRIRLESVINSACQSASGRGPRPDAISLLPVWSHFSLRGNVCRPFGRNVLPAWSQSPARLVPDIRPLGHIHRP